MIGIVSASGRKRKFISDLYLDNMVDDLFSLFLTLGTSVWGWLGVVLGLAAAYLAWEGLSTLQSRGFVSAIVFVGVFMACAWQELRRKK